MASPRAAAATWQGSTTVPQLFAGSVKAWGNNGYLGQRMPGRCFFFEWESFREVELSVLAIARSLRCCVLPEVVPGMAVAIMGPATIEAVKIWQACCHLSAAPLLLPGDGSISDRQLRRLLLHPSGSGAGTGVTAAFVHESSLARLAEAMQSSAAESAPAAAETDDCQQEEESGPAARHSLQLVVVWGAGGIRYTQPDPELAAALAAAGVGRVLGFEDFKRSHFNVFDKPEAAFTELLLPGPEHIAAVVATAPAAARPGAGDDGAAGLRLETVTHGKLVAAAAGLLRQQFPQLEAMIQPYVAEEHDGREWQGRPDFPSLHLVDPCNSSAGLASMALLTRLAAITAAAGRVGCAGAGGAVLGDDAAVLNPNLHC